MCDTIVAVSNATATGQVLFGKNSDRAWNEAQYLEYRPGARHAPGTRVRMTHVDIAQVNNTYAVLLSKPYWIWGAEMGTNEHGLTIGNEALFSHVPASKEPGVIGMDYVRLALERAKGVDEAIAIITSLLGERGQSGDCGSIAYHNSYLIADPSGAAVLETVDREWVVASAKNTYAVSNALTIGREYEDHSKSLAARASSFAGVDSQMPIHWSSTFEDRSMTVSGRHRHDRASSLLAGNRGNLRPTSFFKILRDHSEGPIIQGKPRPRICAHSRENPIGQTTASWVADLTPNKTIHWATGTAAPCTGVFKPLILFEQIPSHGARPQGTRDGESLWWRHEDLRMLLERAPQDVLVDYEGDRDRLEAGFLDRMVHSPGFVDQESRAHAGMMVQECWREALEFEREWHVKLTSLGAS
jgi:secernin